MQAQAADSSVVTGVFASLVLGLAPQIVAPTASAVVVGGAVSNGVVQISQLTLGDGGVRASRLRVRNARGEVRTVGGVTIRAKSEGVKLDFPSGREVLVSPDGRIHLRSGEATLSFFRGVRLVLADDTVVTIRRSGGSRTLLESVEVETGDEEAYRIWSGNRPSINSSRASAFTGDSLFALGDGGCFYTVSAAGPLLALERVLCPRDLENQYPRRRVVVLGDVLARSLLELPDHAPRRSIQFPQTHEAALRFAALGYLFGGVTQRPLGAVGELWIELADEYRLNVAVGTGGVITIGLYREGSGTPGLEWVVASRTTLNFVRPNADLGNGPRYFLRGIDLRDFVTDLVPIPNSRRQRVRVAQMLGNLGGRRTVTLEVKRRRGD